ncbi:BrnA antitoxin family protein [Kozakia baliensis]|uniref:BrnA antitoxin family protein n=1 Tax=Kozakia baliensis TaxID=153496 RepID=UPI00049615FB|nr:BrnA antitoxin family protein [Kozakia baliensis]
MKKLKSLKGIPEERVQEMIASDPDSPELTDDELAAMRPFAEVLPDLAAKMKNGVTQRPVGRPPAAQKKASVSLRLDQDVLEKFKSTGPGWQTRINEALRRATATH